MADKLRSMSIYADRALRAELDARRGYITDGTLMSRELERYYEVLRRSLATVKLSEAEAGLLCDALSGIVRAGPVALLWAEVDEAIRADGLDAKWGIEGPVLVAKLRGLSYAQALALVDAIERFWLGPHEQVDRAAALWAVGLIR